MIDIAFVAYFSYCTGCSIDRVGKLYVVDRQN